MTFNRSLKEKCPIRPAGNAVSIPHRRPRIPEQCKLSPVFKTRLRVDRVVHGAYSLVRHYYAGHIDRRTSLGHYLILVEDEYARHRGYPDFRSAPVSIRDYITLIVGQKLFLAAFETPDDSPGLAMVKSTERTLARMLETFGLLPVMKPARTLEDLIVDIAARREKEEEEEEDADAR